MALLRLSNIANYLTFERNIDNAMQFVGMNMCTSGRMAQIYLGRLQNDLSLVHLSSFGFSETFLAQHQRFDLEAIEELLISVQTRELVIKPLNSKLQDSEFSAKDLPKEHDWKYSIYVPLLPNFAALISVQHQISNNEEHRNYFATLGSILNLYLQTWSALEMSTATRANKTKLPFPGEKLTERQEIILELIKEGMTNNSIASRMGYSESLIRQETMVIYQKLGIDGRKEIRGFRE